MPDELERLQINIEADASGTVAGAAQAKQALSGLSQDAKRAADGIQHGMDKAAQATTNVVKAATTARKTLKLLAANPVNLSAVRQAQSAVKATNEAVRKTLKPIMANPVNERGSVGAYKKYEFAKMPTVEKTEQAAAMTQTAAATAKVAQTASKAADNVRNVRKEIERVGRMGPTLMNSIGRSLRSMLIVTAVAGGLRNFVRWMGNVVSADKQVSASLAQVRGNMSTAFAPIYNSAIPAIRSLVSWLATATAWVATFISTLAGMSGGEAINIAKGLDGIGSSAGGAGKQMKELLGSFDELNKLDRSTSGGGGGGGNINFGELTEAESAVNAAEKVAQFWNAWGDWIKAGAFAGGTAWLLSKFSDLISKIKSGINPVASISRKMKELGNTANALGDSLGDVSKNATITYSVVGEDEVMKTTERIMRGCKQLAAKPYVLRFVPQDNITATIERIKQELRELSARKMIVQVAVNTREGISAINELNSALDKIPRNVRVNVNVVTTQETVAPNYAAEGGGGTTRGGGGGRKDRYSSSSGGTAANFVKTYSVSNTLTALKDKLVKVLGYASGGIGIPEGQLFIANESGAEMVGHIGGKTAVANQQEISGAIWREMQQYRTGGGADPDAIADAVARALNGTAVKVGERQFGTLVVQAVNKNTRQMGRVDFAF